MKSPTGFVTQAENKHFKIFSQLETSTACSRTSKITSKNNGNPCRNTKNTSKNTPKSTSKSIPKRTSKNTSKSIRQYNGLVFRRYAKYRDFWKCDFPVDHNVCLSVCWSVFPQKCPSFR